MSVKVNTNVTFDCKFIHLLCLVSFIVISIGTLFYFFEFDPCMFC